MSTEIKLTKELVIDAAPRHTEEQLVRLKISAFFLPAVLFTVAASQYGTRVIADTDIEFWVGLACKHITAFALFFAACVRVFRIIEDYVTSRANAANEPRSEAE